METSATQIKLGLLLSIPHGYSLLTPQRRHHITYAAGRPHDPDFGALRAFKLQADPLVLDVGGNLGQSVFSILAMAPRARVITFEPNSLHRRNNKLAKAFSQLSERPYGISDENAYSAPFTPIYYRYPLTELASFKREAAADWLGADGTEWFYSTKLVSQPCNS